MRKPNGRKPATDGRKPGRRAGRVTVARPTGFCFGVERAIRLARTGKARFGKVFTLGELVHNPSVLEELEREGISAVKRVEQARGGALVIRAHGAPPDVFRRCRELGMTMIDATCPYVGKVQSVARRLKSQGYAVVVVGERNHPEVRSILGFSGDAGRVYSPRMRLRSEKVGVVAQTTTSHPRLREAVANLNRLRYTELRVFDTICEEVTARQRAAARLAATSDLVVVVGGRNSANTSRLAEIVRDAGAQMVHVERGHELPLRRLRSCRRVGIVAGSSTPAWVVREVADFVRNPDKEDRTDV